MAKTYKNAFETIRKTETFLMLLVTLFRMKPMYKCQLFVHRMLTKSSKNSEKTHEKRLERDNNSCVIIPLRESENEAIVSI